MSDFPVEIPLLTDALVAQIHRANVEAGSKEFAFDTYFRHSDATRCGRAMGYTYVQKALSKEHNIPGDSLVTEPMDVAGEWVTWLGTLIHEKLQAALTDRFGSSVECEVRVHHEDLSSGHIDALVYNVEGIGRIAYELKTKGSYAFDKAIGINRRAYKEEMPEGPGAAAKTQGALNAIAIDADVLVIGIIGMEAVSKQLRQRVGWSDLRSIIAEWHYPRAEYAPWAQAELERFEYLAEQLDSGFLPERIAVGDEGELEKLDPEASRPSWKCSYCPFMSRCIKDGPGAVAI